MQALASRGILRLRRTIPLLLAQIAKLRSRARRRAYLLGFRVETAPEYSGTISFYHRDGEITPILEHEDEQEHEHDLLNFGI
jgi:hypothetical protein